MPLDNAIHGREFAKFELTTLDETAVRVLVRNGAGDPIPVFITDSSATDKISVFSTSPSVGASVLTTIQSYTVPVGKTLLLKEIEVSGDNAAKYSVEIDSTLEARKRTYYSEFNETFNWNLLEVSAGSVIDVKVIHESDQVGDFDSRIIGDLL